MRWRRGRGGPVAGEQLEPDFEERADAQRDAGVGKADGTTYGQVYFGDSTATPAGSLTGTGRSSSAGDERQLYNYSSGIGRGDVHDRAGVMIRGKYGEVTNVYTRRLSSTQGTISADTDSGTISFGDTSGAIVNGGALSVSTTAR